MMLKPGLGSGHGSGDSQPMPCRCRAGLHLRSVPACSNYCGEWAPGVSEALSGCLGQSSGHWRLPPWSHRPGSGASPPTTRTNAAKSAPGQFYEFSAIANPGS